MCTGLTNVLACVPYARGEEQNRLLKDAVQKLSVTHAKPGLSTKTASGTLTATIPPANDRESRSWQPATGAPIQAALVQELNGRITLKMQNGTRIELLSASLSQADQSYLQQLRNGPTNAFPYPEDKTK